MASLAQFQTYSSNCFKDKQDISCPKMYSQCASPFHQGSQWESCQQIAYGTRFTPTQVAE